MLINGSRCVQDAQIRECRPCSRDICHMLEFCSATKRISAIARRFCDVSRNNKTANRKCISKVAVLPLSGHSLEHVPTAKESAWHGSLRGRREPNEGSTASQACKKAPPQRRSHAKLKTKSPIGVSRVGAKPCSRSEPQAFSSAKFHILEPEI